jgi:flagellar assembly protein FliH
LCLPDEVETMSLSRIIKSGQIDNSNVGTFAFRQMSKAAAGRIADEASNVFVPLGIFDTSETGGAYGGSESREDNEPPTVTMAEEELNRSINEAFEKGLIQGKNLAERGLLNVFRSLRIASDGVHILREKVIRESEDELVKLIMMVARKVILREISMDRSILNSVVQAAISDLTERGDITIRLNPDDYILITTSHEDFFRKELITERMHLKSDPSVLQGCCLVDSEMGTIDAGIDAQLDEIFRRLLEERTMSTGSGA